MSKLQLLFIATALTAASAINAQQQPQPAYQPLSGMQAGMTPTPSFDANSYVEGVSLSDAGELAYVVHSGDPGNERTAVITSKRLVARDGEVIEGKTITRVWASALAINARGRVAFEADFKDANGSARGIFIDKHFVTAIKSAGEPSDFALTADGRVIVKPGIAIAPPAVRPAVAQTAQPNSKGQNNCSTGTKIPKALKRYLGEALRQRSR